MQTTGGPNLIAIGSDPLRLQWLKHHVVTRWAEALVLTADVSPPDGARALIDSQDPDAVFLQIDFGAESSANSALRQISAWLTVHPDLYCIVLAENGDELTAVRALKYGARDYLPLLRLTRELLFEGIETAVARRRPAPAAAALVPEADAGAAVEVPGYTIVRRIATSNFSSVFLAKSERLRRNVVLKTMTRGNTPRERDDA